MTVRSGIGHLRALGLDQDASPGAIRKAYLRLAKKWHPDKNQSEEARHRFARIQEAYEYLSRHLTSASAKSDSSTASTSQSRRSQPPSASSADHSFGSGYNSDDRRRDPGTYPFAADFFKEPTIERHLHCTLEELFSGVTKRVRITRRVHGAQATAELSIEILPGYKAGTKITFPRMGDEPAPAAGGRAAAADVAFVIVEKKHPLFTRNLPNAPSE